jgi:cobalamin biosynthesis Mg chelatase CobN
MKNYALPIITLISWTSPMFADQMADAISAIESTPLVACMIQDGLHIYGIKPQENGQLTGLGDIAGMNIVDLGENMVASDGSSVFVLSKSMLTIIDDDTSASGPCTLVSDTIADLLASDGFLAANEQTLAENLTEKSAEIDAREAEVARREAAVDSIIAEKSRVLEVRETQLKALADRQNKAFLETKAALDAREAAIASKEN